MFTLETASMWWSFPHIEFRVLLSHPMGAPIPKGSWSHHLPAVTPLSPIHRLLRVVVAPSLSMSLPMNFLSMYGIGSMVSIMVVKTTVQIIVAAKNPSSAGWICPNPSCTLNTRPRMMSSGQIPVGSDMVTVASMSSEGSASWTLSIDQPTRPSIHPLRSSQSLVAIISPVRLPDAWVERAHYRRDVGYLVAYHALRCVWYRDEHR